jgi:hypothetical protein
MIKLNFSNFKSNLTLQQFVFLFLFVNVVALIFIPITPDENSRLTLASDWLAGGVYDFSWPPMLVLINVLIKFFGGDAYSVRLFFFAIELCLFWYLSSRVVFSPSWIGVLTFPYLALVLNIASPQGLMIILLPLLVYAVVKNKIKEAYILSLAIYLINPTCILIFPIASVMVIIFDKNKFNFDYLYSVLLASFTVLGLAYLLSKLGYGFMPTLTSNGPLNLFLGNNPSPVSFRGGADGVEWLSYSSAQYLSAVFNFLIEQPISFFQNYLYKVIFWLAPFDQFRSGIGSDFRFILFLYVALIQVTCYYIFYKKIRKNPENDLKLAMWIFVMAWVAYTIFFVRLRYRIPFDLLLFIVAFSDVRSNRQKSARTP